MKRVLIVDDSALMRQLLTQIISTDPSLEVVGAARDPYQAWDILKKQRVDVITLDVEMPRMDGLAFLEKLMIARPTPVVMVSSLTERGCETTLRALELGAVDFVSKPKLDVKHGTLELADEIVLKVAAAACAKPRTRQQKQAPAPVAVRGGGSLLQSTHKVIAIGASTGGTEALFDVLTAFPADAPGTVVVQHMPSGFTQRFAERLDKSCRIRVREASDGDRILPGTALLAPGGQHLEVVRRGASYQVRVYDGPPVNRFRPSVDVMFQSCCKHVGKHTVAAILTGMGRDGAEGMQALHSAGCHTIAQDEETCVVFGMPKEAIALGGVSKVLALDEIAQELVSACGSPEQPAPLVC